MLCRVGFTFVCEPVGACCPQAPMSPDSEDFIQLVNSMVFRSSFRY